MCPMLLAPREGENEMPVSPMEGTDRRFWAICSRVCVCVCETIVDDSDVDDDIDDVAVTFHCQCFKRIIVESHSVHVSESI